MDWGSVPAWVGSVLTGGSLLLGFYIILRDRRSGESEQARKLLIRRIIKSNKYDGYRNLFVITNNSEKPFFDVRGTVWGFTTPRWSWSVRHLPIGTKRHRGVAKIRKSIDLGGRDDWTFQWPEEQVDELRAHTLEPGQTVTAKVFLELGQIRFVVRAKDAEGRFWGFDAESGLFFRYERHRDSWD